MSGAGQAPRIKICGLKDAATIKAMNGLPIHEIGLVFAPSKRQVDKETAASLIEAARSIAAADGKPPRTVGVFVNAPLEELDGILAAAPLDVVQLHGDESPAYCEALKRRQPSIAIWRVFSIKPEKTGADEAAPGGASGAGTGPASGELGGDAAARLAPYRAVVDALLIDAPGGGTGRPFNWAVIEQYKEAAADAGLPLYVAGGLHADNVAELLRSHAPDGIDVSSGVETDGRKDIGKIRLFVRKVIQS